VDFAELEFLAGWIALEFLKDPRRADAHFVKLWEGVSYPVSISRGAYWAGRAREAMNDTAGATVWYSRAAEHDTTFYGQLAARKLARNPTSGFASPAPITQDDIEAFQRSDIARLAVALSKTKHENTTRVFMLHAAEVLETEGALALLGAISLETNEPSFAVQISKVAVTKGFKVPEYAYPVVPLAPHPNAPEPALSLAIARQESQMNPKAKSPVGALGLMQVMPATGKSVAKKIGVPYNQDLLGSEVLYNTRIGQAYLAGLIERWGGSYVLAIASYNAGPGNVGKWIERFGDPRSSGVDELNWIESIPFQETRNYVQRVIEGMEVYRNRLGTN
jgi:soluble lytic murein transglycosylase